MDERPLEVPISEGDVGYSSAQKVLAPLDPSLELGKIRKEHVAAGGRDVHATSNAYFKEHVVTIGSTKKKRASTRPKKPGNAQMMYVNGLLQEKTVKMKWKLQP